MKNKIYIFRRGEGRGESLQGESLGTRLDYLHGSGSLPVAAIKWLLLWQYKHSIYGSCPLAYCEGDGTYEETEARVVLVTETTVAGTNGCRKISAQKD